MQPDSTVIVELVGTFRLHQFFASGDSEQDLYSVFASRGEMLSWCAAEPSGLHSLWGMNEADLLPEGSESFAFVQVGIVGDVVPALIPLTHCVGQTADRVGVSDLDAVQITCLDMSDGSSCIGRLIGGLHWFRARESREVGATVDVRLEREARGVPAACEVRLRELNIAPFAVLGSVLTEGSMASGFQPVGGAEFSISVVLPDWTFDAIGWVAALVLDSLVVVLGATSPFTVQIGVRRDRPR